MNHMSSFHSYPYIPSENIVIFSCAGLSMNGLLSAIAVHTAYLVESQIPAGTIGALS